MVKHLMNVNVNFSKLSVDTDQQHYRQVCLVANILGSNIGVGRLFSTVGYSTIVSLLCNLYRKG